MPRVIRVRFESPVIDPVSGHARQDFASGPAHAVSREGEVFTIVNVNNPESEVTTNVRASWQDVNEAPAPTPAGITSTKAKKVVK